MQGAKTMKGFKGNLKFIINYKVWATLAVFGAGVLTGAVMTGGAGVAWGHSGNLAADGCHNHRAEGNRHFHVQGTNTIDGLCDENGPIVVVTSGVEAELRLLRSAIEDLKASGTASGGPDFGCLAVVEIVADRLRTETLYNEDEKSMAKQLRRACLGRE